MRRSIDTDAPASISFQGITHSRTACDTHCEWWRFVPDYHLFTACPISLLLFPKSQGCQGAAPWPGSGPQKIDTRLLDPINHSRESEFL